MNGETFRRSDSGRGSPALYERLVMEGHITLPKLPEVVLRDEGVGPMVGIDTKVCAYSASYDFDNGIWSIETDKERLIGGEFSVLYVGPVGLSFSVPESYGGKRGDDRIRGTSGEVSFVILGRVWGKRFRCFAFGVDPTMIGEGLLHVDPKIEYFDHVPFARLLADGAVELMREPKILSVMHKIGSAVQFNDPSDQVTGHYSSMASGQTLRVVIHEVVRPVMGEVYTLVHKGPVTVEYGVPPIYRVAENPRYETDVSGGVNFAVLQRGAYSTGLAFTVSE